MFFNYLKITFLFLTINFSLFCNKKDNTIIKINQFLIKKTQFIRFNKDFNIYELDYKLKEIDNKYYLYIDKIIDIFLEKNKYYSKYLIKKIKIFNDAYLKNKETNQNKIPLSDKDFKDYLSLINFFENLYGLSHEFSILEQSFLFKKELWNKKNSYTKDIFNIIAPIFLWYLEFHILVWPLYFGFNSIDKLRDYLNIESDNRCRDLNNFAWAAFLSLIITLGRRIYISVSNNNRINDIEDALIALIFLKNSNLEINKQEN
jgi:hypothetical protein